MSSQAAIRSLRQRLVDLENRSSKDERRSTATARAPKPGSRRARKQKRAGSKCGGGGVNTLSHPHTAFARSADPVAFNYTGHTPAYQRIRGNVTHPEHGVGIVVQGRQLFTDVTTTASNYQIFGGTGTATVSTNSIDLSPDAMNGRLALIARTYSRYKFRRVGLHYVPRVATSDVGQFTIGYIQDGAAQSVATTTFASLSEMDPNMTAPFRCESNFGVAYSGPKTWFTELESATLAGERQSVQGQFLGYPDVQSIGALQHGWIWVDYEIELYQPTLDMGFTMTLKDSSEKEFLKKQLERFRASHDTDGTDQEIVVIEGQSYIKSGAN